MTIREDIDAKYAGSDEEELKEVISAIADKLCDKDSKDCIIIDEIASLLGLR